MSNISNIFLIRETAKYPAFLIAVNPSAPSHTEVAGIGTRTIEGIGYLFQAVQKGIWDTIRYSPRAFIHLIFDYTEHSDGSYSISISLDYYVVCFKIVYCAFTLLYTAAATTVRSFLSHYVTNTHHIKHFANRGMNVNHITASDTKLDMDGVPADLRITELRYFFSEINFEDPSNPKYMDPGNLPEKATPEQLQTYLNTFITNVENRVPFLGTPPAYNVVELENFYRQIEDAARASMYRVSRALQEFEAKHKDDLHNLIAKDQEAYKNLLEDRARLVIDLAIAGHHCGGRYMGEAMNAYYHYRDKQNQEVAGTLQETLTNLLAEKRKEIAERLALLFADQSTHAYSQYMQHVGSLLGIPGTEHTIESLLRAPNVPHLLEEFFKEYTTDCIAEAVQEKIKISDFFRQQIIGWLKAQRGDWKPRDHQMKVERLLHEVQGAMGQDANVSAIMEKNVQFLIKALQETSDSPSLEQGWEDFVQELFAKDETKALFTQEYPGFNGIKAIQKRQEVLRFLSTGAIGAQLETAYRGQSLTLEATLPMLKKVVILEKLRSILRFDADSEGTWLRIIDGQGDVRTAIEDHCAREADAQFTYALGLNTMHEQGLPPLLLNWFLVQQNIFTSHRLEEAGQLISHDLIRKLQESPDFPPMLKAIQNWRIENDLSALNIFFKNYLQDSPAVLNDLRSRLSIEERPFPLWKQVVQIEIPKVATAILDDSIIKIAGVIFIALHLWNSMAQLYDFSKMIGDHVYTLLPEVSGQSAVVMRAARDYFLAVQQSVAAQSGDIFILFLLAYSIQRAINSPKLKKLLNVLWNLFVFFIPTNPFVLTLVFTYKGSSLAHNLRAQLVSYLKNLRMQAETERAASLTKVEREAAQLLALAISSHWEETQRAAREQDESSDSETAEAS